jgi:hypothetical protein
MQCLGSKVLDVSRTIPGWELSIPFNPMASFSKVRKEERWVNYQGLAIDPSTHVTTAEEVAMDNPPMFSLEQIPFRDSDRYIAGGLNLKFSE